MATPLQLQMARHVLGRACGTDLVAAALSAMMDGMESESLVLLASERDPIMSDAGPLFERTLRELNLEVPTRDEACGIILRHLMQEIANGTTDPRSGVQAIITEVYHPGDLYEQAIKYIGDSHDIHHLLGAFYGIDDLEERPDEVSFDGMYGAEAVEAVKARMRELAVAWLATHPDEGA